MIPLIEPEIPQASKDYVNEAIDTGWLSYTGPFVKKLEDDVRSYVDARWAIATSSGTGALWLILKALGIRSGDYVAVPSMTFVATVNAVIHAGAVPVFIDCDDSLQMDPKELEKATKCLPVKAVIPVHMLGNPSDMEAIENAIYDTTLIIEDAAQALGSLYSISSNKKIGTWGIASMFSFSFNKLVAAGQGGMVTTDVCPLGDRIKYLSLQAKDDPIMYIHNESGFNVGMSNINAALACGQMDNIEAILKEKKRIKDKYIELLGEDRLYTHPCGNGWLNAYRAKSDYKTLAAKLNSQGIQTRPLFYPNHLQESFKKYHFEGTNIAISKHLHTVCIPSSTNLTDEQIEYVVKYIKTYDC